MVYGYCRCSTNETKQDITRQKRELKELGAVDATIFMEYESGTKINRPELAKLLSTALDALEVPATAASMPGGV